MRDRHYERHTRIGNFEWRDSGNNNLNAPLTRVFKEIDLRQSPKKPSFSRSRFYEIVFHFTFDSHLFYNLFLSVFIGRVLTTKYLLEIADFILFSFGFLTLPLYHTFNVEIKFLKMREVKRVYICLFRIH